MNDKTLLHYLEMGVDDYDQDKRAVLGYIISNADSTSCEIARNIGKPLDQVNLAIKELLKDCYVLRTGLRKCGVCNKYSTIWRIQ
jgi:hypothetical protein